MRSFIAINIDPELRDRINEDTAGLRHAAPGVSWVRPEGMHLTLRFLGEVAEPSASGIATALADVARRHRPFRLDLAGVGTFPSFRHPRVVWIGARDDTDVGALARDVDACCASHGFPGEGRPYAAHLTLGRVRREPDRGRLEGLERAAGEVTATYSIRVSHFELMKSEPGPRGSRYTVVASFPLLP